MLVTPTINSIHGRIRSITTTDPVVGSQISIPVPARRRWRILAINFSLVTGAVGSPRQITFIIDDGTNVLIQFTFAQTQATGLTYSYSLAPFHTVETFVGTNVFHDLPSIPLPAGSRIRTTTLNADGDDNFSAPQLLVEEWIDPSS